MAQVCAEWCSNGVVQAPCWTKTPGESNENFAERVGKSLAAAIKAHPVTDDC